jgi:hypothetical protein
MHELYNGTIPMHAIAMCILMNVALVLSIAALIKYLIKGKCGCGCKCCKGKQEGCGTESNSCCK